MTAPRERSEVVRAPRAVTRTRERAARLARVVSGTAIATVFAFVAATVARAEVEPPKDEGDPATIFRAAVDALAAERPADAIARFEALGDRGVVDPVVSYDRGLAYCARVRAGAEQPGDLGRAAHGFEEARELSKDPALVRDATAAVTAVRAEIAKRRSRAGDPIELDTGVSLGRSIVNLLPENVWAALALVFSIVTSIGIVVRARAELRRAKVAGTTTASVSGGLLLLTTLVLWSAREQRLHLREAIVIAPTVRLLDDKRVAMTDVAPIPEGARVQLLDEGGDFARVVVGRVSGVLPSSALVPMAKR